MATTAFKYLKNNLKCTLSAGIGSGAGTMVLDAGQGAGCPTLPFWMTLFEDDVDVNEVVLVTGRTSDTLTITRAQQGTAATAWNAAANVQLLTTAQSFTDLHTALNNIETRIGDGTTDLSLTTGNYTQTRSAAIQNIVTSYNAGASNFIEDYRVARGNSGTPVVVSNNDAIYHRYWGYDGTTWRQMAEIRVYVNGTPGGSDMPGALAFYVTPDGSATPGLALTIDQAKLATFAGNLSMSAANPTFNLGATTGNSVTLLKMHAGSTGVPAIEFLRNNVPDWDIYVNGGGDLNILRYVAGSGAGNSIFMPAATGAVQIGKAISSGVSALTDAATIATDASLGNTFTVTLAGNRTMGAPTNATNGQKSSWIVKQDGTGSRTITWNAIFRFSATYPVGTLTATAGRKDRYEFEYDSTDTKWNIVGISRNFA